MANTFIQNEVKKVLESNEFPQNAALAAAWIIAHFKGINIKIYDTQDTSSLCDYNIIASAENPVQSRSMIDEIVKSLREAGLEVTSLEGMADGQWVLVDLGDIIVHVFLEVARDAYDLDSLWSHCNQVQIPQEFYFGQAAEEAKPTQPSTSQYF
jgi:ribosome-associated protein